MSKHYINNNDLIEEIKNCRETGVCSDKLAGYFLLLATRISSKLKYVDPMDREDCIYFGVYDMVRYWNRFDPSKGSNAFAYFSQIAKFGIMKGWSNIRPKKYNGTISLDFMWEDSEVKNYKGI